MLDLDHNFSIPQKVLAKAQQLGVHNDCLISEKPCTPCEENIFLAFDFFYEDIPTAAELIAALLGDMKDDLENDIA